MCTKAEKEREVAISLQKRRRKEFHCNGTPGPIFLTLNITEPDVDMENEGSKALGNIIEDEEDIHPNLGQDKGKSKRIPSDDNEEDKDIGSTSDAKVQFSLVLQQFMKNRELNRQSLC